MGKLIGLVRPLLHIMLLAIVLGTAGYLCAIFLTIAAGKALFVGPDGNVTLFFTGLVVMAVMRGILHYGEQYCNHFIAFKLLAIIRHKVFAALRKLCPAKLEGRDKGNLISIITTDIELLEVFYAHTISPICIAISVCLVMVAFIGNTHLHAGIFALAAYVLVGIVIPLWNGKRGGDIGLSFRNDFGGLNSFVLDSLRGLDEIIQYGIGQERKEKMSARSVALGKKQETLSKYEGTQRAITNLVILGCSFGMLFLTYYLYEEGQMDFDGMVVATIAMMGSFGPVVALSSLSNNLNQTLASGDRVLAILEETPLVEEVPLAEEMSYMEKVAHTEGPGFKESKKAKSTIAYNWNGVTNFTGASAEHVTFSYEDEVILKDYSIDIKPGQILGIHGVSGSGKSTLLKLLMRFWDTKQGEVKVAGRNVKNIPTSLLRDCESYVTQETHLFHDSIANNIAIGKQGASREEIMEAAKKASIHDFIMTLPNGYDTKVGELGDTLSGGEKQRIGIARAFLHDAPFILMDEPTSNLDSLNEGIILKSLKEACDTKTVVVVSHRKSTMSVCDVTYEMANGRLS
uniref:amino acid ABC transporter ATP-binding/permease protein n=1 Tax=Agathobacter sp. TaxID=2021311 RepID=UPI004056BF91